MALAQALDAGVKAAYKAVMKPTEGTILTVARLAAEKAVQAALENSDPVAVFEVILEEAKAALEMCIRDRSKAMILVAVPRSMIMQGMGNWHFAATEAEMRSLPRIEGCLILMTKSCRSSGLTTKTRQPSRCLSASRNTGVSGGTTEEIMAPSKQSVLQW